MKRTIPALAALTLALGLAGCSGTTALEDAYENCEQPKHISLADEGNTLSISGEGKEHNGATLEDIVCILFELDTPDRVVTKISSTRALDGTLTDTWDGLKAEWSYHPNSGLSMVIYRDK